MSGKRKLAKALLDEKIREDRINRSVRETEKDLKNHDYEEDCTVTVLVPMMYDDNQKEKKRPEVKLDKEGNVVVDEKEKTERQERRRARREQQKAFNPEGVTKRDHKEKEHHKEKENELKLPKEKTAEVQVKKPGESVNKVVTGKDIQQQLKSMNIKAVTVKFGVATKGPHQWRDKIKENYALTVNDKVGAPLRVKKGQACHIRFDTDKHYELIFTLDPSGGKGAKLLSGTVSIPAGKEGLIMINEKTPSVFFYQERNNEFMGGTIMVD